MGAVPSNKQAASGDNRCPACEKQICLSANESKAEEISKTELSLPMYYGMTDDEVSYVIETLNDFYI